MSTEISTYEQQAIDFLNATKTEFICKFLRHGKHFDSDKEERDIYEITLKRGVKSYSFNFGQSIANSCKTVMVKNEAAKIEVYAGLKTKHSSCGINFFVLKSNDYSLAEDQLNDLTIQLEKQYNKGLKKKNAVYLEKFNQGKISRNAYLNKVGYGNLSEGAFSQCILNAIKREVNKEVEQYIEKEEKTPPTAYDVLACLTKYDPGTFENFCSDFGYDTDSRSAEKTYNAVVSEWQNVAMLFCDSEIELLQEIQ